MPKRNKQNPSGASSRPLFRNARKERMWGGDGTIICPDAVRVQLVWTVILRPGTASGALYYYQFRGNSVYDPDYTGTGTQPNGFDQWASFYNSYVVLGSSISADIMGATQSCTSALVPNFNTVLAASAVDACGYRYAVSKLTGYSGNAARSVLNNRISTSQICGVSARAVTDDTDFSATFSTNPASNNAWFWDFYHQNSYDSSTLNSVVKITIHYDVKFFDPQQQGLSATLRPATETLGHHTVTAGQCTRRVVAVQTCETVASAAAVSVNGLTHQSPSVDHNTAVRRELVSHRCQCAECLSQCSTSGSIAGHRGGGAD